MLIRRLSLPEYLLCGDDDLDVSLSGKSSLLSDDGLDKNVRIPSCRQLQRGHHPFW